MKYTLLLFIALSGCSSLQKDVGDYVSDAVVKSVEKKIDEKLALRNLSIAEVKSVADSNNDGKITSKEIFGLVNDLTRDYATLETKKLVDEKLAQLTARSVCPEQLESKTKEMWNWLLTTVLGLVSAYLGKQVVSAKNDGKRDTRIALLEKALMTDLDGDGKIGDSNGQEATRPT